jgi:two-component system, OmpR family, phosphate regulon sensor histidine kinase PhoR
MAENEKHHPTFEDLEILAEVSQLLTLVDLDRVMQQIIPLVRRATDAQRISLFLLQENQIDWEHIITARNLPADQSVKVVSTVLDKGFAGWVYRNQRGDIIDDTTQDERWIVFQDDPVVTRSAMCVPCIQDDQIVAMITLNHEQPFHFRPYHLRLMEIVANQVVIAIRNAQLVNHLREQRRQLRAVLQSISDVLLVVDRHGKIVMVNAAALQLMGISNQEAVIGRPVSDFATIDSVFRPVVEVIETGLKDQQTLSFEVHSERHQRDFQSRMSIWSDSEQGQLGYVVVMHDVTTLHDLSRFKDEMLRLASHDLRSPLALISGYADMADMDTPDPESPVHEYIDIIKKSVERMGTLVEDLLRIERIRSTPLELHEQTDVTALIKVVLMNTRASAKAKSLNFESNLEMDGAPHIVADAVLIRQSMENLINNAIKYTPEHGSITISAYYTEDKFHFSVQDTGIGIDAKHQPYVFETFFRVESIKNKQKGSGLGLSLVKNVIARHGGQVWLQSELGKGSTFGFWLPLPPPDQR